MIVRHPAALLPLAALLLLAPACSSTRIVSSIPPGATVRQFHRLLVVPLFGDPVREKAAEEAYLRAFEGRPEALVRASEILPAGIGEAAFYDLMVRNHVDGVLILRPGKSGAIAGAVDDYHTGRDLDYHRNSCDAKLLTWVYNKPGDQLNEAELAQPWLEMTVTIIETASHKAAWSAHSKTQGTQGTPFSQLIRTQAAAAVARMDKDGVLQKP